MSAAGEGDVPEMKGGHPPAVKIGGGVRVHQHRARKESDNEKREERKEKEKEDQPEEPNPNDVHKTVLSGVVVKGDKDFPPEAVKAFHEKPKPTHTQSHHQPTHHIQQPRKQ